MKKEQVVQLQEPRRIVLKKGGTALFLRYDEIDWIEAKGKCTYFHAGPERHPVNQNISAVEENLNPSLFVRIHRSTIININRIREIRSWFRGEYKVILIDGTELRCSRTYRDNLDRFIELSSHKQPSASNGR